MRVEKLPHIHLSAPCFTAFADCGEKAALNDTYTKYEPWENPAEYGGIMWFTSKGKKYRLTRNFYKEKKLGELLCEDDGSLVDAEQGALGTILGNVSEAVYDNTVSVAQLKSVTGKRSRT